MNLTSTLAWLYCMEWLGAHAGRPAYRRAHRLSLLPGSADAALDGALAAGWAIEDTGGMRLTFAGRRRLDECAEPAY